MSEGNVQCEKKTFNFLFSPNVYFKNLDSITQHMASQLFEIFTLTFCVKKNSL